MPPPAQQPLQTDSHSSSQHQSIRPSPDQAADSSVWRANISSVLPAGFSFNACLVLSSPPSRCFFWCCLFVFVSPCKVLPDRRLAFSNLHCSSIWPVLPSDQQQWGCMRVGQTHRTTEWFAFGASLLQFRFLASSDVAIQARLNKLWVHIRCRRGALTLGMSSQDARANQNPCVEGEGAET